jgi:hypothetical protein
MIYRAVQISALTLSIASSVGLALFSVSIDSQARSLSGYARVPLEWSITLKPRVPIALEEGQVIKVRAVKSALASQCFLKNPSEEPLRLNALRPIAGKSIAGSQVDSKIHDWKFEASQSGLQVRCEFPSGVSRSDLHKEANRVLSTHLVISE